jgi:hypothetical protein
MKGRMTVTAYVTRGQPALDELASGIQKLLQGYKDAGREKFDYTMVDATSEDARARAKEAGLLEGKLVETTGPDPKRPLGPAGYIGLVLRYGDHQDVMKFMRPDRAESIPLWLATMLRELRERVEGAHHKIGILTGDGAIEPSETNLVPRSVGTFATQAIIEEHFPFFSFVDVDLRGGDAEIAGDLDGLVVTQPGRDLTVRELRRIDQFVMKGKALAVFAGAVNVKPGDATMTATLNLHGLDKLLDAYGITMNRDVVLDLHSPTVLDLQTTQGPEKVQLEAVPDAKYHPGLDADARMLDPTFPCLNGVDDIAVPFASSLTARPERQPDAELRNVIHTSPRAVRLTGDTADLRLFRDWRSKLEGLPSERYLIGAAVTGTIRTAFPGRSEEGIDTAAQSRKPARVFVLPSAQFLANPFVVAGDGRDARSSGVSSPGGNEMMLGIAPVYAQQNTAGFILVFKNTLSWMTLDDAGLACFQ